MRDSSRCAKSSRQEWPGRAALRRQVLLLELAPIVVCDPQNRIIYWNRAAEIMYGFTEEQALRRLCQDLLQTRFPEPMEQILGRLQAGREWRGELRQVRSDGTPLFIETHWVPHLDEQGRLYAIVKTNTDVTRHKQVEGALAMATLRLEGIIASAMDAIISLDAGQRIILFNPAAEKMFGIPAQEAMGQHINRFMPERFRRAHTQQVETFGRTGTTTRRMGGLGKIYGLRASGEEFPIEASISRADAEGERLFTVILRDISVREQVSADLRASEQVARQRLAELEAIYEQAPIGISFLDRELRYVKINKALAAWHGLSVEEHIGHTLREILPEWADKLDPIFRRILETNAPARNIELSAPVPGEPGLQRYWLASYYPVKTSESAGFNIVVVETTDRKRAEEKVAWLASFPELAPVPICEVNCATGVVHYVNPSASRLFPDLAADGLRHPWLLNLGQAAQALLPETLLRREVVVDERCYAQLIYHVQGSNRLRVYGIDITERKRAEELLTRSNSELELRVQQRTVELQEKIAELESFSYSLSHDLRAPVRAISGFAHLALEDLGARAGPRATDLLHRVVSAANRMDALIQDVLTLTRLSSQQVTIGPVDVEKLLGEIILERPELQPPRADVYLRTPLLPICGHEASLTQCLTNLLGNAVKFVAPGTHPRIRIWTEEVEGTKREPHPQPTGDAGSSSLISTPAVRLWIEDNGIGIAQEMHARIFEIFQRLHQPEEYEGTGIGLAIVRKAVERMGGELGVESEPGRGSRFWIQLPRA